MPLAEYLEGRKSPQPAATPRDSTAKLRKHVFLQFGAMIALGLALAGWYVGYRVFTARAARPPVPVAIVKVVLPESKPVPAVTPPPPPKPVESKPIELPAPVAPIVPITKPVAAKTEPPHQPPATSHQQPVTNHQQPVTSHQPPATNHQQPVTSHQQPATSHQQPATNRQQPVSILQQPVSILQQPVTRRKDSEVRPFSRHEATPRVGEKYLQIAAFGPRALDGFLKTLERRGLHPVVAPGPVDNIYRILVGPFANSAALEETRSLIQASGVEPILRAY